MRVLSLFSGIGAFEKALTNLGIETDVVAYCEIDKYASRSYSAIHGIPETKNLGDITKVDATKLPKDIDLLTYGFPCQDISIAGFQRGFSKDDGTKTRSGLFFDALRIIEKTRPKVCIAENVKNLLSKRFSQEFGIVLRSLADAGYTNYYSVLNAKDFGIPQNRERVFIVSIRNDIKCENFWAMDNFEFPEGKPLELRLKDMLQPESEVPEKFYVSDKGKEFIQNPMRIAKKYTQINGDIATCLTAKGNSNWTGTFVGYDPVVSAELDEPQCLRETRTEYGKAIRKEYEAGRHREGWHTMKKLEARTDGICNTLTSVQKDNLVAVPQVLQIGNCMPTKTRDNPNQGRIYDAEGLSPTLNCMGGGNRQPFVLRYNRIRKLTPMECFRLQGFTDEDFRKAEAVNSNTQLYKQAGNSICVPVVEAILNSLLDYGAFGGDCR